MERPIVGDTYTATVTFTVGGVATDPTDVTLDVTAPDGTVTNHPVGDLTHSGTGVYSLNVSLTAAGSWSFVFTGTGTAAGVQTTTLDVFAVDPVASNYATVEEVADWLSITDTNDHGTIARLVGTVSRWIDDYCGRKEHGFWLAASASAKVYEVRNLYCVRVDDIGASSGVIVATDNGGDGTYEQTWQTSDFQLRPVNASTALPEPRPFTELLAVGNHTFPVSYGYGRPERVQVTAKWGWPAVPSGVRDACIIQTSRLFKRKHSPDGIAGAGDFGVIRVSSRLDPDVEALLTHYRRSSALVLAR